MGRPNECKYCGCEEVATKTDCEIVFRCWSSYLSEDDYWTVSNNCGARCAVQLVELRANVQQALQRLETATRFELVKDDYGAYMKGRDSWGNWLDVIEVEQAIEILRGNSPESPDSSPVTADQLATEDYYEAVRQQVPWMVTIEHIEGLVEGYRRCGVMVWRAAKQIKLIFGGGNGQAE